MAIRSDITIDWDASPRVITVAAPSVEIVVQDLHDTCRSLEAESVAMDEPPIIDSSGLEALGGSTSVGLTSTLQNALIAFEARTGPTYTQCSVSGGNVVAVDSVGSYLPTPIHPTAFTQVVVTASSSATIQGQENLETVLFIGEDGLGVTYSVDGYSGTGYTSTGGVIGTQEFPSNDLTTAQTIADSRGMGTLYISGDLTVAGTESLDGYHVQGGGATFTGQKTLVTFEAGCSTANMSIRYARLEGVVDGEIIAEKCVIGALSNTHCLYRDCSLIGPISKDNAAWNVNHTAEYHKCRTTDQWCVIDYNGSPIKQVFSDFIGRLKLTNNTHADSITYIELSSGQLWVDASCTGTGVVFVYGQGDVINDSATLTVNTDGLVNTTAISDAVWGGATGAQVAADTAFAAGIEGGRWEIVSNQMIFYGSDNTTEIARFNLFDSGGSPTETNVTKRVRV